MLCYCIVGVLSDSWLKMKQQCAQVAKKASGSLACVKNNLARKTRGIIVTQYSAPQISCPVLGPSLHEGH